MLLSGTAQMGASMFQRKRAAPRTFGRSQPGPATHIVQAVRRSDDQESSAPSWGSMTMAVLAAGQLLLGSALPAAAVLNSPNAQIARTVDAALRRSIPAFNPDVKKIQDNIEEIAYLLRIPQRKPYGTMANDVANSLALCENRRDQLLEGVPSGQRAQAEALLDKLYSSLKQLELAIKTQQPDFVSVRVADALRGIADLELLQAPGLAFILPKDYANLPRLVGRAVVAFEVEKREGGQGFVDAAKGGVSKRTTIEMTLDGYSAPLTAGNFLINVQEGLYNGRVLQANGTAVIVPASPNSIKKPIPLEILPLGQFDPVYRVPLDVQGGELPVLPLSISGAVSMSHVLDNDSYLSGEEFFLYKFDKQQAGLAGLSFDEGTFGVFGYITKGMDVLTKLQSGDKIISAKVVSGADKLVKP